MLEDLVVRPETVDDFPAVQEVVNLAFQNVAEGEADLIDALRADTGYTPELSLVAELNGAVVGHVIFSEAYIDTNSGRVPAIALGPLAVHPDWQQQGIGSKLVGEGLSAGRRLGHRIAVVIGHSTYYPRFGFTRGRPLGIEMVLGRREESRMVIALVSGALDGVQGTVRFSPVFDEA